MPFGLSVQWNTCVYMLILFALPVTASVRSQINDDDDDNRC